MHSRWNDVDARAAVAQFGGSGEDLALRVYTSRLLGSDPDLVLHGGGNTSVKTVVRDRFGAEVEVLCVKGSGADLAEVGPDGLPALELGRLLRLRELAVLDDDGMVAEVRRCLLDPHAPNPSIEALLHAFLPHRFVDHTHADAICALTNQPNGAELVREALGSDVLVLPWIMPGFPLAQAVAKAHASSPACRGIVLMNHGLLTFGDDARTSYERTIELVDRAERFLERRVGAVAPLLRGHHAVLGRQARADFLARHLPALRGAVATVLQRAWGQDHQRMVVELRTTDEAASFAAAPEAHALCETGPVTPDHVIRTKGRYLHLTRAELADPQQLAARVQQFRAWYQRNFEQCARPRGAKAVLANTPVVVVVEGCGIATLQPTRKAARIAADIAEHTLRVWAQGHALGRYVPLGESELAEMEYWPLELRKLGRAASPPLQGMVALVTGAAGAIGCGIAEVLLEQGACVVATDIDGPRLQSVVDRLRDHRANLHTVVADVASLPGVETVFREAVLAFGGVDVVVPNAGIARTGTIEQLDPAAFAQVQQVNVQGTMLVLQQAARVFRAQGTGGAVVVQASKNTFAPGAGFGAYSASKAAALQLGRIAAIEFAPLGVRVNMVNADAVFGDDGVPSQLWAEVGPERMRARGLDPEGLREHYRQRSLLKIAVTPRHVGEAVAFFVQGRTPTTGAVLPVDGGLPEAFPR
ncbi:MAG: hypothetical protein RL148_578 [Planctomycetota bacterium]